MAAMEIYGQREDSSQSTGELLSLIHCDLVYLGFLSLYKTSFVMSPSDKNDLSTLG